MVGFVSRGLGEPGALSGEVGFVMFALFWSPRLSCLSLPLLLESPGLSSGAGGPLDSKLARKCARGCSPEHVLDAWLQKRYI